MNADDYKKATVDWYRDRLRRFEHGIQALSSGNEERRAIRFKVLQGVGIRPGCSVLDVGCGYADFRQRPINYLSHEPVSQNWST